MDYLDNAKTVKIVADDGCELGGTYLPALSGKCKRVAIVHGATAVPHHFYRRFGAYLQARGISVLLYDFRGVGCSAPAQLKGYHAKCSDWGLLDMPAAQSWVQKKLSPERLYFVGHSAGGQQAGLIKNASAIDAMVTVCAQSGYWQLQGGSEKYKVMLQAYLAIPLLVALHGYLPWSRFAKAEDLPAGVAAQWARWCRHPRYIFGDRTLPLERYQQFSAPVLAISIDDDNWGTALSVDNLTQYSYSCVDRRHVIPSDYGINQLGHLGYFRDGSEVLWQEALEWLLQH